MDLQAVWFSCRFVLSLYLRKVSEFHGVHETMKLVTRGNSCFQNDQRGRPPKEFGSNELGIFHAQLQQVLSRSSLTPKSSFDDIFSFLRTME